MIKNSTGSLSIIFLLIVFCSFVSAFAQQNLAFFENKPFLTDSFPTENDVFPINFEKQNPGKAFLKSLLLPGWGELSVGASKRAKYFLTAEGLLWSGFVSFQVYSHWKRSDLENFAVEKAGVNATGKSKAFYSDVSNFQNIYEYNEEKRRFRQYDEVYPVDEDHFWEWKNQADFERFDELRSSSEIAIRNATLIVGGILIDHILSAIDAVWVTHQSNKNLSSNLRVTPTLDQSGEIYLNFTLSTCW